MLKWDEVFVDKENITPVIDSNSIPISIVRDFDICHERYYVMDGENKRVIEYENNKNEISYIGEQGVGPGEFEYMTNIELDKECNVYIYDPGDLSMKKFEKEGGEYELSDKINVKTQAIDIEYTTNKVITYSLNTQDILKKIGENGMTTLFEQSISEFQRFVLRFSGGGVSNNGKWTILVHPKNYTIYSYKGSELLDKHVYGDVSEFIRGANDFPERMSPYRFTKKHEEWWSKFPHIGDAHIVNDSTYLVSMYRSKGQGVESRYINIHHRNGHVLAEGVRVPENEHILKAKSGHIYTTKDPVTKQNGEIVPTKIFKYNIDGSQI